VVLGVELLEWLRIDDPIGAVPVHGICGIWGTLSLGLFACGKYGASGPTGPDNSVALKGLFYGGGTQVLVAQAIGSAVVTLATFGVAMAVMLLVMPPACCGSPRKASSTASTSMSTESRPTLNMSSQRWVRLVV